jgi:hypothetical protein
MAIHGLCRWHRQQIFHQRQVDTDGKFAAGVTVTSDKSGTNSGDFATGVNDTCGDPWSCPYIVQNFREKKSEGLLGPRGGPGEDNKYLALVMEKMRCTEKN